MTSYESSLERRLAELESDVRFGYVDQRLAAPRQANPRVVVNSNGISMLRVLREELRHCEEFAFSVAFVTPGAIALLKQEFVEFSGRGLIVTSDYLGFNSPRAFAELHNLKNIGIEIRLHTSNAYHPKGYVFQHSDRVTAVLGSSNLTKAALVENYEWNLKVSAAPGSDLADQFARVLAEQAVQTRELTVDWIDAYRTSYESPVERRWSRARQDGRGDQLDTDARGMTGSQPSDNAREPGAARVALVPNVMQTEALREIASLRETGAKRALIISATGTGKTILSALDVRAVGPKRMLFVVHREQILDRAIAEFREVIGGPPEDFGKLAGAAREIDRRYVFATIQTLSRSDVLSQMDPETFDYILIDEVHRAGADSYLRVVEHFQPEFLLGMTATPERTDGFNVFSLFDFNVAYEIRLGRALEAGMLSPFHYYGVADVEFDDGTTVDLDSGIEKLASRLRAEHVVGVLDKYVQAGVPPRGLIFCGRKDEARELSTALNSLSLRGAPLRTVALTGEDAVDKREEEIARLEAGEIDYILSVDVFNEGVDIPSLNQVVLLRQTKSAIVFVQQLGRGLRKHPGKDYLVVLDFIGNYANNYLIPVALFGDQSLNKESLRQALLAAEESGVLPGLSSVRFDRITQERVLKSISGTKLDSIANIRSAIEMLRGRLGRLPELRDFLKFDSVDPVVVATADRSLPALLERVAKHESGLTEREHSALEVLSHEALAAKRAHELIVLRTLLEGGTRSVAEIADAFTAAGLASSNAHVESALRTLSLEFFSEADRKKYGSSLVSVDRDSVSISADFAASYSANGNFTRAVDDLVSTGIELTQAGYDPLVPFTRGRQYSRKDACRLLLWEKNNQATIFGYRVEAKTATCPIFVTYHKAANVSASTAYEDELVDRSTMMWFTRSRRNLESAEVKAIVENRVVPYVFAKKDDAEGSDFYYLGRATSSDAELAEMKSDEGETLDVVRMRLTFDEPIDAGVFDYFHPQVMS